MPGPRCRGGCGEWESSAPLLGVTAEEGTLNGAPHPSITCSELCRARGSAGTAAWELSEQGQPRLTGGSRCCCCLAVPAPEQSAWV